MKAVEINVHIYVLQETVYVQLLYNLMLNVILQMQVVRHMKILNNNLGLMLNFLKVSLIVKPSVLI